MKILSGKYKGRNLKGFTIDGTRPTMDRVKESLFAMIQNQILNSVVLDLFSGSGNLGIEAYSEGASSVYFCDSNYKAVRTIKENLESIGISTSHVYGYDYQKCLRYFYDCSTKFDIIFLDPPYATNYIEKSICLIEEYSLLNDSGLIVCESDSLDKIVYSESYNCVKEKKYGDKYIVILQKI